jgi:hypothetical protein
LAWVDTHQGIQYIAYVMMARDGIKAGDLALLQGIGVLQGKVLHAETPKPNTKPPRH